VRFRPKAAARYERRLEARDDLLVSRLRQSDRAGGESQFVIGALHTGLVRSEPEDVMR
jgi:hypothetical protein